MAIDAVQSLQAQIARFVPLLDSLRQGQVVDARVIAMLTESSARISLLGQMLDVEISQPLQAGSTIPLKVDWEGEALKLVLQQPNTTSSTSATTTSLTNAPRPAGADQTAVQARPATGQTPASTTTPATTLAPSLTTAASGLATVPAADTRQALTTAAVPLPTGQIPASPLQGSVPPPSPALVLASTLARNLAAQPLTQQPTTGVLNAVPPAVSPVQVIPPVQALASNLQSAGQQQAAVTPAAMQAALVSALAEPSPTAPLQEAEDVRALITQGLRQAADKQTSMAPLFANLAAVTQQAESGLRADLPADLLGLARTILGLRLDGDKPVTAQALKTAMAQSGIFLETSLAAGEPVNETTDLKAALGLLKSHLGEPPEAVQPRERQPHERIPVRGGPVHGQPAVPASLSPDSPTPDVLRTLHDQSDSSLARLTLTQATALPDARDPTAPPRPDQPQQFTVEIPIRYQGETTIAQMQVSRDAPEGRASPSGKQEPRQWTMRFSMDCEPIGPVHAAIRLLNDQVGIRLWAERPQTVQTFTTLAPMLEQAMAATPVKCDGIVIAEGRPTATEDIIHAALNPRHLLDRRS